MTPISGASYRGQAGMCGRYTQLLSWRELVELYNLTNVGFRPNLAARYNLAPTQDAPIVRLAAGDKGGGDRELTVARWGLIPAWAKDASIGARMINARAESVADKPAFRAAYRQRRCLVPASGFFEWQERRRGPKQPYYITLADGAAMTFAGLWERWRDPADGRTLESYTILTTEANALLRPIHAKHRMPVILEAEAFDRWLDPARGDAMPLLAPYPAEAMAAQPVSTEVNKAWDNKARQPVDHPGLIEPLPPTLL